MTTIALSGYHERIAQRREHVAELTRNGYSTNQIAVIVGTTPRTVVRLRAAAGVSKPSAGPPMTDAEIARAKALLDDGCSYREVARTLGRAEGTIARRFPGRGWPKGLGASIAQFERWANYRATKNGMIA